MNIVEKDVEIKSIVVTDRWLKDGHEVTHTVSGDDASGFKYTFQLAGVNGLKPSDMITVLIKSEQKTLV